MAPNRQFIGKDWNGFASVRFQFSGFRTVVFMRYADVAEAMGSTAAKPLLFDKVVENSMAMKTESELMALVGKLKPGSIFHATIGPHDAAVTPPGWFSAEETQSVVARGLRRTLLTANGSAVAAMAQVSQKNPVTRGLLDFVAQVVQARQATAAAEANNEKKDDGSGGAKDEDKKSEDEKKEDEKSEDEKTSQKEEDEDNPEAKKEDAKAAKEDNPDGD